jgi:hypothetical protein
MEKMHYVKMNYFDVDAQREAQEHLDLSPDFYHHWISSK